MTVNAIGLIELTSIAKGIQATDIMLKTADVTLLFSRSVCPGKYIVLITGAIAAVNSAIASGEETAGHSLVDTMVIARIHPQLIGAITLTNPIDENNALGVLEYFSMATAIISADTAAKAADVNLIELRLGTGIGGKSYTLLTGKVDAVSQAVEVGANIAAERGMLVEKIVIANPHTDLYRSMQ